MSRRLGNRRRKKILGMNDTTFYTICSFLMLIIVTFGIYIWLMQREATIEKAKIVEEKERINAQIEEIYQSTIDEMSSLLDYKSATIVRVSAVGDILCGNNMQKYGQDFDSIFEDISKYFKDSNLNLGTYETDVKDVKKEFAQSIKKSGIDFVSLAHNHAMDNGEEGLKETEEYLKSLGIETVGVYDETPEKRVKIVEKRGVKIAILGYTYDDGRGGVNIYNENTIKEDLKYAEENAQISIVMMHWGDVNTNKTNKIQEEQRDLLIDNGADIIIGAHPSAIQKMEMIENKYGDKCFVAYSVGDYTSEFANENANLELILNFQIYVDKNGNASIYKVDYIPVYMLDRGSQYKENRYKILDMKKEIAMYDTEESNIDKNTYDKLVRGVDRLNSIIQKQEQN